MFFLSYEASKSGMYLTLVVGLSSEQSHLSCSLPQDRVRASGLNFHSLTFHVLLHLTHIYQFRHIYPSSRTQKRNLRELPSFYI